MTAIVSRAVMALAMRCLGGHRREWALAMRAEFEVVRQDGQALGFAIGCLLAAWREMPSHREGQLRLARHAFALGLITPVAALLLSGALFGVPYPDFRHVDLFTFRLGGAEHFLNDGNRTVAPVLALLLAAIAVTHFAVAWAMLDRDWARAGAWARLGAASTVTLVILSGLALLDTARTLLPVAGLIVEIATMAALVRLHDRPASSGLAPEQDCSTSNQR